MPILERNSKDSEDRFHNVGKKQKDCTSLLQCDIAEKDRPASTQKQGAAEKPNE
jgi:hypothetical protein